MNVFRTSIKPTHHEYVSIKMAWMCFNKRTSNALFSNALSKTWSFVQRNLNALMNHLCRSPFCFVLLVDVRFECVHWTTTPALDHYSSAIIPCKLIKHLYIHAYLLRVSHHKSHVWKYIWLYTFLFFIDSYHHTLRSWLKIHTLVYRIVGYRGSLVPFTRFNLHQLVLYTFY